MTRALRAFGIAAFLFVGSVAFAACPPVGHDRASLQALRAADWRLDDDRARQTLAIALLDCLGDPDPAVRDELAFAAISHWSRAGKLDTGTLQAMRTALVALLTRPAASDDPGFSRPFAALALAEIARADRLAPFLSAGERAQLVDVATAYLAGVRDHRGFDAREGWRHGVAHGADLLLQLSLHPALETRQLEAILAAVATQVTPDGHFYVYGEGERLMAPVFYVGRRDAWSTAAWSAWFAALAARAPTRATPVTQATLAVRHDLSAFLLPLYASIQESGTAEMRARMLPGLTAALKAID